jgi:hypothetical protein
VSVAELIRDARDTLELACLEGAESVAIFAAMDESYQGGRIAAVGGYVSTKKKWFKLIKEWMDIIVPTRTQGFHMTDAESGRGDFEYYWTPDYLFKVKLALFERMLARTKFGVVVAVDLQAYKELTRGKSKDKAHPYIQSPYYFCLFLAVQTILKVTRIHIPEYPDSQRIPFVFDQNDQFSGRALKFWPAFQYAFRNHPDYKRIGNLVFADDQLFPPLQAADILAYEGAKRMLHQLTDPNRPWRQSLTMLSQKKNLYYAYYDRADLVKQIDKMKADGFF